MKAKKVLQTWVAHHPNGGWQVLKDFALKAIKRFHTQRAAIKYGRSVARGGELLIQSTSGQIREKNSVKFV